MNNISAGGTSAPVPKFSGKSGKIPSKPTAPAGSLSAKIGDAMRNGMGSYRDIDNAFFPDGAQDTNSPHYGQPRSQPTSAKKATTHKKKVHTSDYSGGSGGSGGSDSTSAKQEFHYYEAPLAEMYGFSPETAYQEALANTAIRREMNDMRKAGLNPSVIYGSHNSSGADSGIIPRQTPSDSGGGGGGGSRRRSGKSNSGKYLFSGGAYYGTMAAVGTTVAIATKNIGAGMAAAGLAGTAMKALNGILKKK